MGTRSAIGIRNPDGSISAVYCHWDGYPENNGRILLNHYSTEDRVRELLSYGDISSLGSHIGERHPFDQRPDDTCNFYIRDRGETGVECRRRYDGFRHWFDSDVGYDYWYLFDLGFWYIRHRDESDGFRVLTREECKINEPAKVVSPETQEQNLLDMELD